MNLLEIHIRTQKNTKDKIEFQFINKNNSKFSQHIELPENTGYSFVTNYFPYISLCLFGADTLTPNKLQCNCRHIQNQNIVSGKEYDIEYEFNKRYPLYHLDIIENRFNIKYVVNVSAKGVFYQDEIKYDFKQWKYSKKACVSCKKNLDEIYGLLEEFKIIVDKVNLLIQKKDKYETYQKIVSDICK